MATTTYIIRTFGGVLILPTIFITPQNTIKRTLICFSGKRTLACS